MTIYSPKQRNSIYSSLTSMITFRAPIIAQTLGQIISDIAFAVADQIHSVYVEQKKALRLLNRDNLSGTALEARVQDFPNMAPRFAASRGTGFVRITDSEITVISSTIALGGSESGDGNLNVDDASSLPAVGTILVGTRGADNFESFTYDSKSANNLISSTNTLAFDHGAGDSVVLTTVGDRIFAGPFVVSTRATAVRAAKKYDISSSFTIFDGDNYADVTITSQETGTVANTEAATIVDFIGTPPFAGALLTNQLAVSNARSRESDLELNERLKKEEQGLSTANIDAIALALDGVDNNGQRIRFQQQDEGADPTLPTIYYIDDGSGFVPDTATTTNIILEASAFRGRRSYRVPMGFLPMITTDAEDAVRVFSNIVLQVNGQTINQGDGANEYRIQPHSGIIRLNTLLEDGDSLTISTITHYTGLLSLANKTIYGDRNDRENFRGVAGLGAWIKLVVPTQNAITIEGKITFDGSRSTTDVIRDVRDRHLQYINSTGIGSTIVRNRLQSLGFIRGVRDFTVNTPSENAGGVVGQLQRVSVDNINLS